MTLPRVPSGLPRTRDRLHQIAYFVLSPARYRAIGRMGLRATPGGFGTPAFLPPASAASVGGSTPEGGGGRGRVLRIESTNLVEEQGGAMAVEPVTTIRAAVEFFGEPYEVDWFTDFHDRLPPLDPDQPLDLDPVAIGFVAEWFEFGWSVLEALRGEGAEGDEVSEAQLWPEHFDAAIEMGDQARGARASFGASPGDGPHDEPYFYVSAVADVDRADPYWNDSAFNGASLAYRDLAASADPSGMAMEFLLRGHQILGRGPT